MTQARLIAPGPSAVGDARVLVRVKPSLRTVLNATVIVASLGYFVDVYDLLLFSIVRVPSLQAMGVTSQADLLNVGVALLNWQMGGLLVGGVLWGVLGDKRGRVSVLFGSILLYSVANLANAFATDVAQYSALRFLAGVGLAGELGAAVTLVTEIMPKETRGYGAAIVSGAGVSGAVLAGLVAAFFDWRMAFLLGGAMGLALLVARMKLVDSGMFKAAARSDARRGDVAMLVRSWPRFRKYAACILVGLPLWYVVGILLTFSPELSRALAVGGAVVVGSVILVGYAGITVGSLASGILSQRLASRRAAIAIFMAATAALVVAYLTIRGLGAPAYYALCFGLGFGAGYWAVFMTTSAEQFGTNLRATVATTVPNFVRGGVVPMTLAFTALRAPFGVVGSALAVGVVVFAAAGVALGSLPETFGREMDFVET